MARRDNPMERTADGKLYLGSVIRQHRHAANYTVDQLARLLDLHPASLSKIENNRVRPSSHLLSRIAETLDIASAELEKAPLHPRTETGPTARGIRFSAGFPSPGPKVVDHSALTHANHAEILGRLVERLYEAAALAEELLSAEEPHKDAKHDEES